MCDVKMVCSRCGSEDVTRDAVARWSVEAQEWRLCGVYDNTDCQECGGECDVCDVRAVSVTGNVEEEEV